MNDPRHLKQPTNLCASHRAVQTTKPIPDSETDAGLDIKTEGKSITSRCCHQAQTAVTQHDAVQNIPMMNAGAQQQLRQAMNQVGDKLPAEVQQLNKA